MSYRDDDQDLLNDPDKRVGEARGVLSALFRQLLVLRDIDGWLWDRLMKSFLNDPRNGIQNNSRDRSSARGNLNKELKRDDMTWRVFLKALYFLDPVRVVFTVKVTFKDGKTNEVSARLKDRGNIALPQLPAAPVDDDESGDLGPEIDEEIAELDSTETRPTALRGDPREMYSPQDMIDAVNNQRKHS